MSIFYEIEFAKYILPYRNFAMYDASGFETRIRKNRLLHNNKYKVYILYKSNNENTLIDTGESIPYE